MLITAKLFVGFLDVGVVVLGVGYVKVLRLIFGLNFILSWGSAVDEWSKAQLQGEKINEDKKVCPLAREIFEKTSYLVHHLVVYLSLYLSVSVDSYASLFIFYSVPRRFKFCGLARVAWHRGSILASHRAALGLNTGTAVIFSLYCLVGGLF